METQLKVIGGLLIVLALIHVVFPKYFNWKQELSALSLANRQIMYVHSFFIAFMVLLLGVLCVTSSADLVNTALGNRISLGIGIFWGVRLLVQFFGYSPKLWKGKSFETTVHIVFSIFWTYLTSIFITAYLV